MIQFNHVTKIYENGFCANKDLSFEVKRGTTVGIIGANGSGKTTLIRQLLGILEISKGEILVDDSKDYLNLLSYVPQFPVLYPALSVKESLKLTLLYQGVNRKEIVAKIDEMLQLTQMQGMGNKPCYTLSGGQQKLLSFAGALIQDKPYLILDEVTSMVDIVTKQNIWSIIKTLKKDKGILIASHDMEEVKQLCDYVVILKDGEVSFYDKKEKIGAGCCSISVKGKTFSEDKIFYNLGDALSYINKFENCEEILNIKCDYPNFDMGVLNIVAKN